MVGKKIILMITSLFVFTSNTLFAQNEIISSDQIEKSLTADDHQKDLLVDGDKNDKKVKTRQFMRVNDKNKPISKVQHVNNSVNLSAVTFEYNSAVLTTQAKSQLKELAISLSSKSLAGRSFELIGHTDAKGGDEYNMSLSLSRANAVVDYLQHKYSVSKNSIKAFGMGETKLADPSNPFSAANRRVEIIAK